MVLLGDYKVVNGGRTITDNVEDVVSGLALVIVAQEEKAPEKTSTAGSKK